MDKIDWEILCDNPSAIHILEKNEEKICWMSLSSNPNAVHLLERNLDKVDWSLLSSNQNAIHILQRNIDKIDWFWLAKNPSIFRKKINYRFLKEKMDVIREEMMMKCMHPRRLERWIEMAGDIDDF